MIFTFSFCSLTTNQNRPFFFYKAVREKTLNVCPQTSPEKVTSFFRQSAFFRINKINSRCLYYKQKRCLFCSAVTGAGAAAQIFMSPLISKQTEGVLLFLCALGSHGRGEERGHVCGHVAARGHQQRGPRHQLHTDRALQQVSVGRAWSWGLRQKSDKKPTRNEAFSKLILGLAAHKAKIQDFFECWRLKLHHVGCDRASQQIWDSAKVRYMSIISYVTSICVLSAGVGCGDSE